MKAVSRFAACLGGLLLAGAGGCNSAAPPAKTEAERRINVGADPNTVQGKQARGLMDGQLVPAPTGVKTGFDGGKK